MTITLDGSASSLKTPLTLADFDFEVPPSLIAQQPASERDGARLLVYGCGEKAFADHGVHELPALLPPGSLVVVNNTQVFASRIFTKLPSGGRVELFLLACPQGEVAAEASALARPLRKLQVGMSFTLADDGLAVSIVAIDREAARLQLRFNRGAAAVQRWLERGAHMPLPPYIDRRVAAEAQAVADRQRYQTVYARELGSVAAPTAGLHFTPQLLQALTAAGHEIVPLTLHVGADTFRPVKNECLAEHPMHEEEFCVSKESLQAIVEAKKAGRKIVVVGTTSLRTLESLAMLAQEKGCPLEELAGEWQRTRLFIYPRHRRDTFTPWSADYLMTNFHQPQSTLFMLVCALIGYEAAQALYRHAVAQGYRFYSYGDTSLLKLPGRG